MVGGDPREGGRRRQGGGRWEVGGSEGVGSEEGAQVEVLEALCGGTGRSVGDAREERKGGGEIDSDERAEGEGASEEGAEGVESTVFSLILRQTNNATLLSDICVTQGDISRWWSAGSNISISMG